MPESNPIKKDDPNVAIDTSGPEVDVALPEEKTEEVVNTTEAPKQETETTEKDTDKTFENERETKLEEKKDQELEDYSKGVQARIAKLTRKMREAERREKAATEYARAVEEKRQKKDLKKLMLIILKNLSQLFHQEWKLHKKNLQQLLNLAMHRLKLKLTKELQHSLLRMQNLRQLKKEEKLNKQHRQRNLYNSPMGQLKCHQNQHQIQEPKNGLQGIHGLVKTEL